MIPTLSFAQQLAVTGGIVAFAAILAHATAIVARSDGNHPRARTYAILARITTGLAFTLVTLAVWW